MIEQQSEYPMRKDVISFNNDWLEEQGYNTVCVYHHTVDKPEMRR